MLWGFESQFVYMDALHTFPVLVLLLSRMKPVALKLVTCLSIDRLDTTVRLADIYCLSVTQNFPIN